MIDLDELRALVADIRPIASPIHTTRVLVRTRTWNGGEIGTGDFSDSDFQIGSEVRVSKITQKEILTSGGFFNFNDVKVTHITPPFNGGGYSLQQIAPSTQFPPKKETDEGITDSGVPDPAVEYIYVLSGEINGNYRLKNCADDHALHYTLFLEELDVHATSYAR
jgi:hypothetical protein